MTASTMLSAALEYLDMGLSVIPLKPRDKTPLIQWRKYQNELPTEDEVVSWWQRWPDANIGIVTGRVSGVWVIDADGPEGTEWVKQRAPATPVCTITGRAGGTHYWYKANGKPIPSRSAIAPHVDIKADGGYVVAPPSIHPSGARYQWHIVSEAGGWSELPEFSPDQLLTRLSLDLSGVKPAIEPEPTTEGARNVTLASLAGRLAREMVPLETAIQQALEFNAANSPPLPEAEVVRTVRSIYKTHARNHPTTSEITSPQLPTTDQIKVKAKKRQTEIDKLITIAVRPGGLMQEVMDCIAKGSAASIPLFAMAGAVTLIGALVGQRVMTETRLRTNLYTVTLGTSGSGKNAPVDVIPQILTAIAPELACGTEIGSTAALFQWLEEHPRALAVIDEFGMFTRAMKANCGSNHIAELPRLAMKLWSGTNRSERKIYRDSKLNIYLPWHHLSIYGTSTPEEFWHGLSSDETVNGFLARLNVFQNDDPSPLPAEVMTQERPPAALLNKLRKLWEIEPPKEELGDIASAGQRAIPIPYIIPRSTEAASLFHEINVYYHDLKNANRKNSALCSIYGRGAEHTAKLALIHHISLTGADVIGTEVTTESIRWGHAVADLSIKTIIAGISNSIASNPYHALEQKLMRIIRELATDECPGATGRDIAKRAHESIAKVDEALRGLISKGIVGEAIHHPGRGPAKVIYYIAEEIEEG